MVNCGQTVAITEVLKLGILNFQTKQLETLKLFHVAKAEKLDVTMIFLPSIISDLLIPHYRSYRQILN